MSYCHLISYFITVIVRSGSGRMLNRMTFWFFSFNWLHGHICFLCFIFLFYFIFSDHDVCGIQVPLAILVLPYLWEEFTEISNVTRCNQILIELKIKWWHPTFCRNLGLKNWWNADLNMLFHSSRNPIEGHCISLYNFYEFVISLTSIYVVFHGNSSWPIV